MSDGVRSHRLGLPLLTALLAATPVQAQIVTDGSVGRKVTLSGGEIKIGANLGTRRGDNLFHSFEKSPPARPPPSPDRERSRT
jgi:large exoprotein involved in heme utilization and adhesion